MRGRFKSRKVGFAAVFAVALVIAGGAFAYFSSTGSGSGAGTVGSPLELTITAGSPTSELYPGGSADVAISISNPNSFTVHVIKLALDDTQGTDGFDVTGGAGCTTPDLSFADNTNGGPGWDVPPGAHNLDLTDAISMGANADNGCQGATFTVYLKSVS